MQNVYVIAVAAAYIVFSALWGLNSYNAEIFLFNPWVAKCKKKCMCSFIMVILIT